MIKHKKEVALLLIALSILLVLSAIFRKDAEASHGVVPCGGYGQQACLSYINPLLEQAIWKQGEMTWCLNSRASTYPQFRQQVEDSMADYASKLGIAIREVSYPTSQYDRSCHVKNDMPTQHGCSGCAAWVYTQSWPVLIEYKWQLGYVFWNTTIAHEFGHAVCLLDEHYDKQNFVSYILTYGRFIHDEPTVMDFGTSGLVYQGVRYPRGIWELTAYDVARCKETLLSPRLTAYGIGRHVDGTPYIFYCDGDSRRATRVAVLKSDFVFGYYWTGQYVTGSDGTQTVVGRGCKGENITQVPVSVGDCFWLNEEIGGWPASWERSDFRNDVLAGCF